MLAWYQHNPALAFSGRSLICVCSVHSINPALCAPCLAYPRYKRGHSLLPASGHVVYLVPLLLLTDLQAALFVTLNRFTGAGARWSIDRLNGKTRPKEEGSVWKD